MKIHKSQLNRRSKQSGFTLVELVVGMSITTVITVVALQLLSNTQKEFSQDTNNLDKSLKRTSIIDVIGSDIRQAGEQIEDPRFPVVKMAPNTANASGGDSLVLYRGLGNPLPFCNTTTVPINTSVSEWFMSSTDATVINSSQECRANTVVAPQIYPANLQEWSDNRAAGKDFGVIHSNNGQVQPFKFTNQSETTPGSTIYKISNDPFVATFAIDRRMLAYLVEKKEYLVCDKKLYMRLNSAVEGECPNGSNDAQFQIISSNIDEMKVEISLPKVDLTTGDELIPAQTEVVSNSIFPPLSPTPAQQNFFWRNIQLVKIQVKSTPEANDCSGVTTPICTEKRKKLVAESSFYPRNVMSARALQNASPSASPTASPTASPSASPSTSPSASPTASPTASPSASPSASPKPCRKRRC
jgi:prepilin-type N-terminal cleavage/methylation domain-containing protein